MPVNAQKPQRSDTDSGRLRSSAQGPRLIPPVRSPSAVTTRGPAASGERQGYDTSDPQREALVLDCPYPARISGLREGARTPAKVARAELSATNWRGQERR